MKDWDDDEMHGKGKYLYTNGDIYKGDFFEGMIQGIGVYEYAMVIDMKELGMMA